MIKFKNGSEIHIIPTSDAVRSSRSKVLWTGKATLKEKFKDFWLKLKNVMQ